MIIFGKRGSTTSPFVGSTDGDIFLFGAADLAADDVIVGGSGFDILQFTSGGELTGLRTAQVFGIDAVKLSDAGNAVTLTNALVAGADSGTFMVVSGKGDDLVDASAVTNGRQIVFFADSGTDTFIGSAGQDIFVFPAATLNAGDIVLGGHGADAIAFSSAGDIAAAAFTNVTGVDAIFLGNGDNRLVLSSGLIARSDHGRVLVYDGTGNDIVDASLTSGGVSFFSSGGNDTFVGGAGSDFVSFRTTALTSADTVTAGGGFDFLHLSGSGSVAGTAFDNVSGIDAVILAFDESVALSDHLVSGADAGYFAVIDGAGDNVIDASAITLASRLLIYALPGADTFRGGAENDYFIFGAADLDAEDTVDGGGGYDFLVINTGGTVDAAAQSGVSDIEAYVLAADNLSITLNEDAVAANGIGLFTVLDTGSDNLVDASGVDVSQPLLVYAYGTNSTYQGSAGRDYFAIGGTDFAQIDGNGGIDQLVLDATLSGQTFDLSAVVGSVHDVEVISLNQANGAIFQASDLDVLQFNDQHALYVLGNNDDEFTLDGDWSLSSSFATNDAVAPGVTFFHFHSAVGADVYIQSDFPLAVLWENTPWEQFIPPPDVFIP